MAEQWDIPYIPPPIYARAAFGVSVAPDNPPIRGPIDAEVLYGIRQGWDLPYVPQQRRPVLTPSGGDAIQFTKYRDAQIAIGTWPSTYLLPQLGPKRAESGGETILFTKYRDFAIVYNAWPTQWPLPQVLAKFTPSGGDS